MTTHQKRYNISISKHESSINFSDIEDWISAVVKRTWSKKEFKHKIIFTFNDIDDAFKFKLRWPTVA